LVPGTSASLAAWADLAIFGNEAAQQVDLFIVYFQIFICAELADFWAGDVASSSTRLLIIHYIIITHC
jgi:hypothetical protein